MINRRKLLLLLLFLILLFIIFDLAPLFQRENLKDISSSDFRLSIGPFLAFIAVFLSYRLEIKKEKNTEKRQNP